MTGWEQDYLHAALQFIKINYCNQQPCNSLRHCKVQPCNSLRYCNLWPWINVRLENCGSHACVASDSHEYKSARSSSPDLHAVYDQTIRLGGMSSAELIIYGAAYGRANVTGKVRSLRKDQKLTVKASNDVFGDTWHGVDKSLVIVYKYDTSGAKVKVGIASEGKTLSISPPEEGATAKSRFSSLNPGLTLSRQLQSTTCKLNITGAAYGLGDVTAKAQSLVTSDREFNQLATNEVWGDTWKGKKKSLVVVYEYCGVYMVDIATEGERMHFISSPPLSILGAAYGLGDVTPKVNELMLNRSFEATADNDTFGDHWHKIHKTLVIVYQYGEETPTVATAKEGDKLQFMYSQKPDYKGSTNPNTLTILGAAYGPADVTAKVQSFVKDGTLKVKASNDVFHDSWKHVKKSLVIVYRYGRNNAKIKYVEENGTISLSIPVPKPYADLIEANDLFEDGNVFSLTGLNGKLITCDSNNRLVAVGDSAQEVCKFTVKKDASSSQFKILSNNGKYIVVGAGNCLFASGSAENAAKFTLSVSTKGGLRFATSQSYIRLDTDDVNCSLKADAIDYLAAYTIFDVSLQQTEPSLMKQLQLSEADLSECDKAWISFIWNLTGGFFLAIGLGPLITIGEPKPGVLNLIKSNPTAWEALMAFKDAIISSQGNITAAIAGGYGVISILYKEGLLWTLFKWVLSTGVWWLIGTAIAKIIQIVFIPESEVAELLASFTTWAIQTVQSGLEVGRACN